MVKCCVDLLTPPRIPAISWRPLWTVTGQEIIGVTVGCAANNGALMTFKPNHDTPRSDLLHKIADKLEGQIGDPANLDDPKWLGRNASKKRLKALKKEKALEHKLSQRPK